MGKGRNKNKDKDPYSGPIRNGRRDSDSDESYTSGLSIDDDMRSVQGDADNLDDVMDKLAENLENAQHKNVNIRKGALGGLIYALTAQYLPEFILKNKVTITSILSKMDNKPSDESQMMANLLAVLAIQVGEELSDLIDIPMSQMRTILMDTSKETFLRKTCALSLAIVSRMSCSEDEQIASNIKACQFAWTTLKNNTTSVDLFSNSIGAWCLLLLDAGYSTLTAAMAEQPKILNFLAADQLDIRIAAGEALAFLHELLEKCRPGFRFNNHEQVLDEIEALAFDSTKKKTKKDKRVQRFTFREISSFMSGESDPPEVKIKFGKEALTLDTCEIKLFYDLCCGLLYGGMMRQLQFNEVLREVFGLEPVAVGIEESVSKSDRMAYHGATDKYRNQVRGRQRDKRNAVF